VGAASERPAWARARPWARAAASLRVVLALVRKEIAQIARDRATVVQLLVIPVIQLLLLANAASFEVRGARVFVVDEAPSPASRALVARFAGSGYFRVVGWAPSGAPADEALLDRRASVILRVPRGFDAALARGPAGPDGAARVQLVVNAEDGAAAAVVQSYAAQALAAYGAEVAARRGGAAAAAPRLEVRTRGWYNPALDYHVYMVPGILVSLVTMVGTLVAAQSIAREKEIGTIEQLNVTPVGKYEFIAGKLLPFWLLAMAELAVGLLIAHLVFDVPVRGSVALVFGAAAVYLAAALGVGLLVSTTAETQQQAQFVSFFVLVVYLLMSGLFTPVDSMPRWAQWLAELNPVKHFVGVMRAVLVKGAGAAEVARPIAMLAVYAVAVVAMAVRRYRKTTA
jgi:ABC-2 type transport system permease protein